MLTSQWRRALKPKEPWQRPKTSWEIQRTNKRKPSVNGAARAGMQVSPHFQAMRFCVAQLQCSTGGHLS